MRAFLRQTAQKALKRRISLSLPDAKKQGDCTLNPKCLLATAHINVHINAE
jgi:hypothetical protein